MTEIQKVRTRFAPSPTGYPHIGSIYQALFNYAYAKKYKGSFIVRIEDTDRSRFVENAEDTIFSSLDWFSLTEDESPRKGGDFGPYRQSERLFLYHKYAQELIDKGFAYFSYFPKKEAGSKKDYSAGKEKKVPVDIKENPPRSIAEMIEKGDWVVRMKVPYSESITVNDEIRGEITFPTTEITEQVLLKSDGFPTYHLAVVVDDHLMEITDILRAEEWLSSLPKHVLLYKYFGWDTPPIYHTATLRNPDKSKLSKRHGHTNVNWYKEQGYLPEAILNYLALLGWSHPDEKEIFSLEEFIQLFELKDIRPIAPIFDLQKLNWVNGVYIRNLPDQQLKEKLLKFYPELKDIDNSMLDSLVMLSKERIETLTQFFPLIEHFIKPYQPFIQTELDMVYAKELEGKLNVLADWNKESILEALRNMLKEHKIKMNVFYRLFTGQEHGLPLPETLEFLGKDETLKRLSKIVK